MVLGVSRGSITLSPRHFFKLGCPLNQREICKRVKNFRAPTQDVSCGAQEIIQMLSIKNIQPRSSHKQKKTRQPISNSYQIFGGNGAVWRQHDSLHLTKTCCAGRNESHAGVMRPLYSLTCHFNPRVDDVGYVFHRDYYPLSRYFNLKKKAKRGLDLVKLIYGVTFFLKRQKIRRSRKKSPPFACMGLDLQPHLVLGVHGVHFALRR